MKLVECVPNFSEGKSRDVIDEICAEATSVDGVRLLDVDPGAATNRTVVTLAGPPEAVGEAAFRAIRAASRLIDMSTHQGAHPRMGATDVCPFVPLSGVTMDECVALAQALGRRVGEELKIPVYLYEAAATSEERRSLAFVRKGEYEGLKKKFEEHVQMPDFGPATFNPRVGATAIGAREFLIAYNVTLNTRDRKLAQEIALNIREAGRAKRDAGGKIVRDESGKAIKVPGKLKNVRATGWYIEEYRRAQVSINLTNFQITSIHDAFEASCQEAEKLGLRVTGSEIVGLVPMEAMVAAGRYYRARQGKSPAAPEGELVEVAIQSLGLEDIGTFDPEQKIIENRFVDEGGFSSRSLVEFIEAVAGDAPAPGGGSVSALCGSLAAALAAMVAGVTYLRKDAGSNREKLEAAGIRAQTIKARLAAAIQEDSDAFDGMMAARRLKSKTPEEKAARDRAMLSATIRAIEVPLSVVQGAADLLECAEEISRIGASSALSDVGVAALAGLAAAEGAYDNVLINLPDLSDSVKSAELRGKAESQIEKARVHSRTIRKKIDEELRS
jgi:glutamate formiminotransferase/formiminotetrahydrofolate cyclodeaminase